MRVFMRIITILYMTIFVALGAWLAAFGLQVVPVESVTVFFQTIYDDQHLRAACGLVGAGVILFNLMVVQMAWARFQRQRTIAFTNADGQVTIALGAIEDFIRRTASQVPEIRDLRSEVLATKKGIEVTTRVSLRAESHIPEVTEKIQGLIKTRVQEMLGIEDPVWVKVHVAKIVARDDEGVPPRRRGGVAEPPGEWPARATLQGFE